MKEEKPKKKRKKAPIKREPSSSLEMDEREETRPKVKAPIKREPSSSLEMDEREETRPKVKKAAEESGGEHKKNWRETHASKQDIAAFLNDVILLRHNVITDKQEFRVPDGDEFEALGMTYPTGKTPLDEWRGCKEWQTVNDRLVNSLCNMLGMQKETRGRDIWDVIGSDFVPLYNPFVNYLHRLPPWDGESNPILELSMSVTVKGGTEEQMLFYVCLRKWLVAMIAGWLEEGKVNQEILVFVGRQGIFKTTWFGHLLPPELQPYFHSNTSFGNMIPRLTMNKLGRAMTALGFEGVRSHGQRGYLVVAYQADDIKANRSVLAYDARPESEASAVSVEGVFDEMTQ